MVKVHVQYCGGWGYGRHYNKFKDELQAKAAGVSVEFEFTRDPGTTGNFEITIDGALVHSKKGGDGFPDSDAKWEKILAAVKK